MAPQQKPTKIDVRLAAKSTPVSTPSVAIIGAGFSGLCAAIQLRRQLDLDSFTIFEANHDVGGTWLTNTYPGCACDVPSHLYSLSFEPNPRWTHAYSPQAEIWEYLRGVAKKYDLYAKIQFNTKVESCLWDEAGRRWTLVTANGSRRMTQHFDVVVNGCGALRDPYYPQEFLAFNGGLVHSGAWDPNVSLEGKVVGVVGSGSSAVQLIPSIAPAVKELHVFQRQAPYVFYRFQHKYSATAKALFAWVPLLLWLVRCILFLIFDFNVRAFKAGHWFQKFCRGICDNYLRESGIEGEDLRARLTPKYMYGCKRVCYSETYFDTFKQPHVTLHTSSIKSVEGQTLTLADGSLVNLDILILCTGYKVQDFFAPMKIVGRDGADVLAMWRKETPKTYYGIVSDLMPNMFMLLGPNTLLGHNSVVFMAECQVEFMVQAVGEMMRRRARVCQIRSEAQDKWMASMQAEMKGTVWGTEDCGSWYTNERNEVTTIWPSSCTAYWRQTKRVRFFDFSFE